ncbi:L-threonine 3-dehydrogenase [Naumannella sp. ID2617S]|nr:L-threonine 3-dehydrogenase [Naumannella sp. ID2617S]
MRALVKTAPRAGLELIDVPIPKPGPTEVLVKVRMTGICGTDLHIEAWDPWAAATMTTPRIVGHEFCGDVVAVGSAVTDVAVGDFVSGEGHLVCGRCRNCLAGRRHLCANTRGIGVQVDGCFAEYLVMPAVNIWVHRVPVSPEVAAIFDPFGNAVHTALAFPCLGEDVLVTGAGPIGIMAAMVVRHAGARFVVVSDLSEERLALAEKLGATVAIDPRRTPIADAARELGMREGFDIGLEMSGAPVALRQLVDAMAHGGRIAMLGLPADETSLDFSKVVLRMLTLKGIYGREIFETWYAMSVLVQSGLDISGVITHRFDHTEHKEAFATARSGHCGKIVMSWE